MLVVVVVVVVCPGMGSVCVDVVVGVVVVGGRGGVRGVVAVGTQVTRCIERRWHEDEGSGETD